MKKFSELEYKRPDMEELEKVIDKAIDDIANASSYDEMKRGYFEYQDYYDRFASAYTIVSIRNTLDLNNEFYDAENKWLNEKAAMLMPKDVELSKAMLNSKYRNEFANEFGDIIFKNYEAQIKTQGEGIVSQTIEIENLSNEYSKTVATCSCDFRGEKCNFYGLLKHMQSTDRDERREAFNAWADMYESVSDKLDDIYTQLVKLRSECAKIMGFDSYIDYIYLVRGRYDYNAKDVERFREYVAKYITPYINSCVRKQTEELGIDKVRCYDERLTFKDGNPAPNKPTEEMVSLANRMYHELSEKTGEFFDFMCENQLFDLETRVGKHMGGYCTFMPDNKAPFIFSNFNGTSADVDVLTHEAGHAFEAYTASRSLKLTNTVFSTSEINEIHSMSMEFFTHPWMELFFGEDADKYRYAHTLDALSSITYLVCVDEFQHRVFENIDMTALERRKVWRDIEKKYMPWRDYDGNEFLESGGFWMQKQHIFMYPFYYIDYALAQTCAFSYFARSLDDPKGAFEGYVKLCEAGGGMGYFDLLKYASLPNPFCEATLKNAVEKVINELDKMEKLITKQK